MAFVKTFRLNPEYGVPDKDIRVWLSQCEKEVGPVHVSTQIVPAMGDADPRMTVIATRLDPDEDAG